MNSKMSLSLDFNSEVTRSVENIINVVSSSSNICSNISNICNNISNICNVIPPPPPPLQESPYDNYPYWKYWCHSCGKGTNCWYMKCSCGYN